MLCVMLMTMLYLKEYKMSKVLLPTKIEVRKTLIENISKLMILDKAYKNIILNISITVPSNTWKRV